MPREFTDDELRLVAEFVARRYLEVERGLRPRQDLRRFLTEEAYEQQHDQEASRFNRAGMVAQSDLGQMIFQRPRADRAHVAIPARQDRDRWGALVMELGADPHGVWRVTELTRAQDRNLTRAAQPAPTWRDATDEDDSVRRLAQTLQAVRVARTVAAQRHRKALQELARIAPEKPSAELRPGDRVQLHGGADAAWATVRQVAVSETTGEATILTRDGSSVRVPAERPIAVLATTGDHAEATASAAQAARKLAVAAEELSHWDRHLASLEHEHALLRHPAQANVGPAHDRGLGDPPDYLTRILGHPHAEAGDRHRWDQAAEAIERYRQRWGITTNDSALGPPASDPAQQADRAQTAAQLRDLTSGMSGRAATHGAGQSRTETTQREGTGLGPFGVSPPGGRP